MKILLAEEVRQLDAATIASEPISSVNLMKRAGRSAYIRLRKLLPENPKVLILCGSGNNGGDGLVIAKEFSRDRIKVNTRVIPLGKMSEDCESVSKEADWEFFHKVEDIEKLLDGNTFIIDCILGSGQDRPLKGEVARLIEFLNSCNDLVISVDIPTGLLMDGQNGEAVILQARHTISLHLPKLGFLLPPHGASSQSFEMVDIGLDQEYINSLQSPYSFVLQEDIRPLLKRRDTFSHKGNFGHIILLAGSEDMSGAALLAAKAGLRSGCGKITVASTPSVQTAIQANLPECMVRSRDSLGDGGVEGMTLVAGPGLGRGEEERKILYQFLKFHSAPCVLDADALFLLGQSKELMNMLPQNSILTPHPGEFKFLTGKEFHGKDGFNIARDFALKNNVYLLVKGAYSGLFCPDGQVWFNSTGNPAMAKGGSGDVLSGMIGAFLAQGHEPKEAALIASYLHGLAGDISKKQESLISVLASDIISNIGLAYNQTIGIELEKNS